ncbi:MAG TPA: ribbon-helix-helix domain-containing protein [Candidatus Nanoarchaeia archaeon]|nr:ribbon-helix-helix domain-containing protein [Candidatus Nanoarchaeia archaeon]
MKTKLSISIDSSLLQKIDNLVELGIFRSRSHAIDFSIVGAKYGR